MPLLSVKNLTTCFHTDRGSFRAVDDVSFDIEESEAVGLVGESGCGKSVTGLSILRLVPTPPGEVVNGTIVLNDQNLLSLTEQEMLKVRGSKIAMVFQEPMTSLNPVFTIGNQIVEAIRQHQPLDIKEAEELAVEMLNVVGVPQPDVRVRAYPHELSGGLRQRAMIAMALSCKPDLLIADEPTTALDVTIQAQILDLLRKLQDEYGMSVLLVSHNLGVIAELTSRVIVMYAGRIVEMAPINDLFTRPLHPYTKGLYASLPSVARSAGQKQLNNIKGVVPEPYHLPSGCKFRDRCPIAKDDCAQSEPELRQIDGKRFVRCFYAE